MDYLGINKYYIFDNLLFLVYDIVVFEGGNEMNFLVTVCSEQFQPIWNIVGFIVKTIWIGVPILLIVLGSIDLGKAVIASKEDEVKKAWKAFGRRFLYAVAVFLVVWLVGFVFTLATDVAANDEVEVKNDWRCCWNMAIEGNRESNYCSGVE